MAATDAAPEKQVVRKTNDAPKNPLALEPASLSMAAVATHRDDTGILSQSFQRSSLLQLASNEITIPRQISGAPAYAPDRVAPASPSDGRAPKASPETLKLFDKWLSGGAASDAVKEKLKETLGYIDRMPEDQRRLAINGLREFIGRGDSDHHALPNGDNPRLDQQTIAKTLEQVNRALSASKLNPMMGPQAESVRNQTIAQFLNNIGDVRDIKQGHHLTCVLDGKIKAEATQHPDVLASVLADAITSTNGNITMPDGHTQVRLDKSFMQDDSIHSSSRWAADGAALDQSLDTRMLTGIYTNAITQQKGFTFEMDVAGTNNGDRMVARDGRVAASDGHGHIYLSSDLSKGLASPFTEASDSSMLQAMTNDGQKLATSEAAWHPHGDTSHIVDVGGPGGMEKLAELVRENGIQQVGLSANILFGLGTKDGGHVTNLTGVRQDSKGNLWFHVEDTNVETSGWVRGDRLMAAINNDASFYTKTPAARVALRSGGYVEDTPILHMDQAKRLVPTGDYTPPYTGMAAHSIPNAGKAAKTKKSEADQPPVKRADDDHHHDQARRLKLALAMASAYVLRKEAEQHEQEQKEQERRRQEEAARRERDSLVRLSTSSFMQRTA